MRKAICSAVLFDLDGTLIDTNGLVIASFQFTLQEKLGMAVSATDIYPYFGEPLIKTMERFAPGRGQELVDFYRTYNLARHDELVRNFSGMPETVAALAAAGVKLGVVTSKRRDMALRGLRCTGLDRCISTLVAVDDLPQHKPDPAPALLALERLGQAAGRDVLMVGDSRFDILCGRNAGLTTAAVGWTVMQRQSLDEAARPDHWVEQPADLLSLVLGG